MLVSCDASGLEWRVLLELSKDIIGIQEILEKQDVHSRNQTAFNLPTRLIAKIFLFRTIYRGSGWSFANDPDFMHVSISPKFWDGKNESFFNKYKGIDKLHKTWGEQVVQGYPIDGPLGRSWTINLKQNFRGELVIPWTTLTNYPVQGTGADVMMFARIMAYKRIKQAKISVDFISTVHDSIVVDCLQKYIPQVATIFHEVFADLPKMFKGAFGYTWEVPMECEVKYGMNMKEMVKLS